MLYKWYKNRDTRAPIVLPSVSRSTGAGDIRPIRLYLWLIKLPDRWRYHNSVRKHKSCSSSNYSWYSMKNCIAVNTNTFLYSWQFSSNVTRTNFNRAKQCWTARQSYLGNNLATVDWKQNLSVEITETNASPNRLITPIENRAWSTVILPVRRTIIL